MSKRLTLWLAVLLLLIAGALPVLDMLLRSLFIDGRFTLEAWNGLLADSRQWLLMRNSLLLASLVTLFTFVLGVPLGILLGKTDLPLRRALTLLFTIPLLIPPYIVAVAWSGLLQLLAPGGDIAGAWLFGLPGCVLVLSTVFLPIPLLLTQVLLRSVDPQMEEAGRLATGWRGVLAGITLPLILPGVLLAAVLVFLLALGEFSVPNYLRYAVFPVESFTQFSAFYDFSAATTAALPLAGVALILVLFEALLLHRHGWRLHSAGGGIDFLRIPLGRWHGGLLLAVALAGLLFILLPIGTLTIQSLGSYGEALRRAGGSLANSLLFATGGATLLATVGFLIGYLIQTRSLRSWRAVDTLTLFLLALPGTVIGIGLTGLWNRPLTDIIYATPLIILIGYLARYIALTSRINAAQLAQIPPSMEEAAQIAGAGWYRRIFFIVIPLAWRGLLASWLVGYIFSLRDTGITLLVHPAGAETLPVRILTLMANGSPALIAALCVIMIAATLVPAGLLWAILASHRNKRSGEEVLA
ncbi:MAG TPA: iron ABC transporter permease [Gammaproteobacteria bacterium]|nr:iron ABC transporter permease [Gammaproteobacteria bacterium]